LLELIVLCKLLLQLTQLGPEVAPAMRYPRSLVPGSGQLLTLQLDHLARLSESALSFTQLAFQLSPRDQRRSQLLAARFQLGAQICNRPLRVPGLGLERVDSQL